MPNAVINGDLASAGKVFVDPAAYADEDRFQAATALLRRDDPVYLVEGEGFNPFWAITSTPTCSRSRPSTRCS